MKYLPFFLLFLLPLNAEAARFYIDLTCTTPGTGVSATCDGAGGDDPFATLDAFADVTRVAGDVAIVKRGNATTTSTGNDLTFTTDGALHAPITITADFDNAFGNFATSSQTVTAKYGSRYMATSASTTDMFPHTWIYIAGDCYENPTTTTENKCGDFYKVQNATSTGIELELPYLGGNAGSGKTVRVMPSAPMWNIPSGDFQFILNDDDNWRINGININSTDINGGITLANTVNGFYAENIFFVGNDSTSPGVNNTGDYGTIFKDVVMLDTTAIFASQLYGAVIDGLRARSCSGNLFTAGANISMFAYNTIVECPASSVISFAGSGIQQIIGRNNQFNSDRPATAGAYQTTVSFEDHHGVVGSNKYSIQAGGQSGNLLGTTTVSTTDELRPGGGAQSMLFLNPPFSTASAYGFSTMNFPRTYVKLFEYPFYTTANTTYTTTAYFKATTTAQWTTNPTTQATRASSTPEMFLECDVYADDADADRRTIRSNTANDVDFDGSTNWQDISVSFTPTQTGNTYCRGWYGKPRDGGAAQNQFYMDTLVEISS